MDMKNQIRALVIALPEFEARLLTQDIHPFELYLALTRLSGSIASTPEGGGGISNPMIRSMTHLPRITGEVVVPFAVTRNTLA